MSSRSSECTNVGWGYKGRIIKDRAELLRLLAKSVNRRRSLIRGVLDGDDGKHCAMGCFWADHKRIAVTTALVEEIATINDSLSERASPRTRWKKVTKWLREQIEALP